jgi:hypothetical protein
MAGDIVDAVHEHVVRLRGYNVRRECGVAEMRRRSIMGV